MPATALSKRSIEDLSQGELAGKRVLVRADFNVPLKDGQITDDTRIRATLPTIRYLLDRNAKVILTSHLGRPKGKTPELSLAPVAKRLSELLGREVKLAPDVVGDQVKALTQGMQPGDVVLLENVRWYPEEEKNEPAFAKQLAELAEVYVNDAFGTAHRAHASTAGVAAYLPSVAGFLLHKEIDVMGKALSAPERPFVAIIGGSKVSSKIGVLQNLIDKVDRLVIGGGMIFTFLKAQGLEVGKSLVEEDKLDLARELMKKAKEKGVEFVLPDDILVAKSITSEAAEDTVSIDAIPADLMGVDVGPLTIDRLSKVLGDAKTVIWNGPMGVFENPAFAEGTRAVAQILADRTAHGAITIVGGGDSVAAVESMGLADQFTHVSTGGGASLEFLEGLELPGVAALSAK
ncbi:Phosphoglycerate kinase [compost metagenome]